MVSIRSLLFAAAAIVPALAEDVGVQFVLDPFTVTSTSSSTTVSFTVTNPGSIHVGGGASNEITISWTGTDIPTCLTQGSGAGEYWAQIVPGTFVSTSDFEVFVEQSYIDEIGNVNSANVTIDGSTPDGGYTVAADTQFSTSGPDGVGVC